MSQDFPDYLTTEELAAIRRRLQATTPGPWCHHEGFIETCSEPARLLGVTLQRSEKGLDTLPGEANAAFIAHARSDIPRLLAEIERLRESLALSSPIQDVTLTQLAGSD